MLFAFYATTLVMPAMTLLQVLPDLRLANPIAFIVRPAGYG
jgi:hypothetical protein